jgi:hypothetical protein
MPCEHLLQPLRGAHGDLRHLVGRRRRERVEPQCQERPGLRGAQTEKSPLWGSSSGALARTKTRLPSTSRTYTPSRTSTWKWTLSRSAESPRCTTLTAPVCARVRAGRPSIFFARRRRARLSSTTNRSGRSPACCTESREVYGAPQARSERLEHVRTEPAVVAQEHTQPPRQRAHPLPNRHLGDHLLDQVHRRVRHAG